MVPPVEPLLPVELLPPVVDPLLPVELLIEPCDPLVLVVPLDEDAVEPCVPVDVPVAVVLPEEPEVAGFEPEPPQPIPTTKPIAAMSERQTFMGQAP